MNEKTEYKQLAIVARYNEDISWIEKIEADVVVYNKGDEFNFPYNRIDTENYGREAETFVRAIVDTYHLLDDYEHMIFLQGNPFQHCKDVIDIVNLKNTVNHCGDDTKFNEVKRPDYLKLSDSLTFFSFPNDKFVIDTHVSMINVMFGIKSEFSAPIFDNEDNFLCDNFLLFHLLLC